MTYYYNQYGWLVFVQNGRETSIEPPDTQLWTAPVVGQPWPNFTGNEWVEVAYSLPPAPPAPTPVNYGMIITPRAFMGRIGTTALTAIYTAMPTNSSLQVFRDVVLSGPVDLSADVTKTDLDTLVPMFLSADKANIILTAPVLQSEVSQ